MLLKIVRIVVAAVAVVVIVSGLIVSWGTGKANKLIEDGNTAVEAANKFTLEASPKYDELFSETNLQGFPGNREQMKASAQEVADLFGKSAEQFRVAATKFEEATKQAVDSKVAEYWTAKVQAFQKMAEAKDAVRKIALILTDDTVENIEQFTERATPLSKNAQQLNSEAEQFTATADKIQADNKDKFK